MKQNEKQISDDVIRVHVKANSNSAFDQYVKYEVKDGIINLLNPFLANFESKDDAQTFIVKSKNVIESYATHLLKKQGVNYVANVSFETEHFEEKNINNISFSEGDYLALVISLGNGSGNNWWGLIFPSLSYVKNSISENEDVVYVSKIKEIYNNLK